MCLAAPGQLVSITADEALFRTGVVDFGGARREVALACAPEARAGDYVLVHAGVAITVIDEAAARRMLDALHDAQADQ